MQITSTTIGILVGASLVAGAAGALVATRVRPERGAGRAGGGHRTGGRAIGRGGDARSGRGRSPSRPPRLRATRPAPIARTAPPRRPVAPAPAPRPRTPPRRRRPRSTHAPPIPAPIEPPRVAEAPPAVPQPRFEDLEVPAQSVIGLQLETTVSSETARVEDEVIARVTRDVRVGDRVVIPAGAKAHGEVTLVERGARVRERARLGVRFTSIVLADGTRLPIDTEPIYREGDSVRNENAAKIGGGAIGGAIIGGILGGAKGAAIGGSIGAGAGTAAVAAGGRNAATLPSGAPVTVRIERPVTVTVER